MPHEPIPLVKEDGAPFSSEEVADASARLGALGAEERVEARNRNSDALAQHDAARMLIVSGPGTGKSMLFKARIKHLLSVYPGQRVEVTTFVRKLVRDLTEDIATDAAFNAEQRGQVGVSTLHRLARSVVERNNGTQDLSLREHCLVITERWQDMAWQDAVSLADGVRLRDVPWKVLEHRLFDGEQPTEAPWASLRSLHLRVQKFYNALTFPDLILFGTQAALENRDLVANTLFIIDEFQDFNLAEDAFIRAMTSEAVSVLLVGDDDQVLYNELRRSHASIIRGYYADTAFVNAMLPFCGRCSFHITSNAQAFLAAMRPMESIEKVFLPLPSEPAGERVRVVASTTPSSGVDYIAGMLEQHAAGIAERQEQIDAGNEKDPYLLILTPARAMNFLKPGGARDRLLSLLADFTSGHARLSDDYWRTRDYYDSARESSQNFKLRKVMAHEEVAQRVVTALLRTALETETNFADREDVAVVDALRTCAAVRDAVESDASPEETAAAIAEILSIDDVATLAADLARAPIAGEVEREGETAVLGQKDTLPAVELTTIVGAKGLSADHVIVLGCDEVNLSPISGNAFFVALTRARKSLTLLASQGGGGATALHDFVRALPPDHTQAIYVKAGETIEYPTIADLQAQLDKVKFARARAMLSRAKTSKGRRRP